MTWRFYVTEQYMEQEVRNRSWITLHNSAIARMDPGEKVKKSNCVIISNAVEDKLGDIILWSFLSWSTWQRVTLKQVSKSVPWGSICKYLIFTVCTKLAIASIGTTDIGVFFSDVYDWHKHQWAYRCDFKRCSIYFYKYLSWIDAFISTSNRLYWHKHQSFLVISRSTKVLHELPSRFRKQCLNLIK